jgi:hypothetical protein
MMVAVSRPWNQRNILTKKTLFAPPALDIQHLVEELDKGANL